MKICERVLVSYTTTTTQKGSKEEHEEEEGKNDINFESIFSHFFLSFWNWNVSIGLHNIYFSCTKFFCFAFFQFCFCCIVCAFFHKLISRRSVDNWRTWMIRWVISYWFIIIKRANSTSPENILKIDCQLFRGRKGISNCLWMCARMEVNR